MGEGQRERETQNPKQAPGSELSAQGRSEEHTSELQSTSGLKKKVIKIKVLEMKESVLSLCPL